MMPQHTAHRRRFTSLGEAVEENGSQIRLVAIFIISRKSQRTESGTVLLHDAELGETDEMLSSPSNGEALALSSMMKGSGFGHL